MDRARNEQNIVTDKEKIEQKIEQLTSAMKTAAFIHLRPKNELKRNFEPSKDTLELFEKRQTEKEGENWEEVKQLNKQIKKSIRADKRNTRIKYLEEELWYDLKKAKMGYLPKHTKLTKPNGEVAKSTERAEVLADFFEKQNSGEYHHKN